MITKVVDICEVQSIIGTKTYYIVTWKCQQKMTFYFLFLNATCHKNAWSNTKVNMANEDSKRTKHIISWYGHLNMIWISDYSFMLKLSFEHPYSLVNML